MDPNRIVASAMHAAMMRKLYPDVAYLPEVNVGPAATAVLMRDLDDRWIVCVHPVGTEPGEWHVTGDLPPIAAARAAALYALKGLPGDPHGREE